MEERNELKSFDEILDKKYGKPGSKSRTEAEDNALSYYSGLLLKEARMKKKLTQSEVGSMIGADAAYISRIENNTIIPSAGTFFRIANVLGYSVELIPRQA